MKKKVCILLFGLLLCSLLADQADARWRWRRSRSSGSVSGGVVFGGTDQERCYQEAKYMYENNIHRHIGGQIGGFEGWGMGGPGCATCTPRGGMTLTGDAHYGNIRVRSWR